MELTEDLAYELEIVIPKNTLRLQVFLEGAITHEGTEEIKLNCSNTITIGSPGQTNSTYLSKNEKEEFILSRIGRNGESYSDVLLKIFFKSKFFTQPQEKILKTNEKGELNLGTLENIEYFSIEGQRTYFPKVSYS